MKDKTSVIFMRNVVHRGYEGQNLGNPHENVLHKGYESQNQPDSRIKMSLIATMKTKPKQTRIKIVLHPRPNPNAQPKFIP